MKAVQSAMAIRRQRHRREEQRRAKARRNSHVSDNCMLSPTASSGSIVSKSKAVRNQEGFSTVTSFHVGIVFLFMGTMLVISGSVPGYTDRDWENLLSTGGFLLAVGIGLLVINRFAASKEDEQFSQYISSKMAPAKAHQQSETGDTRVADVDHRSLHDDAPNQLESIMEETVEFSGPTNTAARRPSHHDHDHQDHAHWTDEVAPVHKSHRQPHHQRKSHQHHQTAHHSSN